MRFLILYFDVAPYLLLAASLVVFLKRKLPAQHPFFFAFLLVQLAYFLSGAVAYGYALSDPRRLTPFYQWVVVTGLAVSAVFELGVLYELSDRLLLARLNFWSRFPAVLHWTAATLVILASVISALMASGSMARVEAVFQALNFSSNLIEIGLLLTLVFFTRLLGISWRSLPAGVALGLGISAAAEMAASALIPHLGPKPYVTVDLIRMAAFHVCVLVWFIYLLVPEKREAFSGTPLQVSDLEAHLQELQRMVKR